MASAAAVAADSMESPLSETSPDGVFTGSVHPNDLAAAESDEDGEEDDAVNGETEADGGLFGDDDDDEDDDVAPSKRPRLLDDEELDSGDDLDRVDRAPEVEEPAPEGQTMNVIDVDLPRVPIPQGSDGEVRGYGL